MDPKPTVSEIRAAIQNKLSAELQISPQLASDEQYYKASALVLRDMLAQQRRRFTAHSRSLGRKQVYYLSMEFLMGKSLKNTLYNLDLTDVFSEALSGMGVELARLYDQEPDPGLGNGGLGRLAACYLDALATTGYGATGYTILYEYGIFRQKLEDGWQSELPDYWLPGGSVWLEPIPEHTVPVRFGGRIREQWDGMHHMVLHEDYTTVLAVPCNLYVSGYRTDAVSTLRLWQAKSPGIDMDLFNKGDYLGAFGQNSYAETISKVLYPNDSHIEGKLLRLRQQYFMAAASVADILRRHMSVYGTVENFPEKNAIHINDTHPALAIPEFMRILLDDYGYGWEQSWNITTQSFAYTNHTVMSEALECWDLALIEPLLPRVVQIIREIDCRLRRTLSERCRLREEEIASMAVLRDGQVHMANLCVAGSHSVNGVSRLHSQILRERVFPGFYRINPAKFRSVTNGIASRRWLLQANPLLTDYIRELIGDGFLSDFSQLSGLRDYAGDSAALERLAAVKRANKDALSLYLRRERGLSADPASVFDVQVKRLHEYKRQHMNALHILWEYLCLRENPSIDFIPKTYLFGAKAAPGYYTAKQIIKFIWDLGRLIDGDPAVKDRLKIIFLEEYNVSMSERLVPAAELSEQISLAGTEASGTGNMKLMLGGAITIGTLDGANVEILEQVGEENILLFGMTAEEAQARREAGYDPARQAQESEIAREVLRFMNEMRAALPSFGALADYLTGCDRYMALADLDSYVEAQRRAASLYRDQKAWQAMSLRNIAGSGLFCADRSVLDYVREIWRL